MQFGHDLAGGVVGQLSVVGGGAQIGDFGEEAVFFIGVGESHTEIRH